MVIDLKNTQIKIKDGSTNFILLKIGNGNLTYDEHKAREYIKDRGKLDTVRDGDEEPVDVRFDAQWTYLTGTSTATIEDALKRRGPAAAWVNASADVCEPYCVDIEITFTPPCIGQAIETIVLQDFRYETIGHDPKASNLSIAGKCNIKEAQVARGAVTS